MASRSPFLLKGKVGRLGNTTFYTSQGRTIQKPITAVANPKTPLQMARRIVWPNIVRFNTLNSTWNRKSFERRKPGVHDYQLLMQSNLNSVVRVFIPQPLIRQGACVVAPYLLTQGSLPRILVNENITAGVRSFRTSINLKGYDSSKLFSVAEFSRLVLANNFAVKEGWQLSLIRLTQSMEYSIPRAQCTPYELKIDTKNEASFFDYMPSDMVTIQKVGSGNDYFLAVNDTGNAGGFAFIWSSSEKGKTRVSTQSVIMIGTSILDQFTTDEAYVQTLQSYGVATEAFLDSTLGETDVKPIVDEVNVLAFSFGSKGAADLIANFTPNYITLAYLMKVFVKAGRSYACLLSATDNITGMSLVGSMGTRFELKNIISQGVYCAGDINETEEQIEAKIKESEKIAAIECVDTNGNVHAWNFAV